MATALSVTLPLGRDSLDSCSVEEVIWEPRLLLEEDSSFGCWEEDILKDAVVVVVLVERMKCIFGIDSTKKDGNAGE